MPCNVNPKLETLNPEPQRPQMAVARLHCTKRKAFSLPPLELVKAAASGRAGTRNAMQDVVVQATMAQDGLGFIGFGFKVQGLGFIGFGFRV